MAFKKFNQNDIFYSVIESHPSVDLAVYNATIYKQKETQQSGAFVASVPNAPPGNVSLYELNVDRTKAGTGLIYPFITKNGTLSNFQTVSTQEFNNQFSYGDTITGSYPLTASISRQLFRTTTRPHVSALRNTFNYYKYLSQHYAYKSRLGNKATQQLNLISIPSIFYGSSIERGTVDLKFYISGSLIGRLQDKNQNGELIQVSPSGSTGTGSVAGVVLYNEGFISLTGSWPLESSGARNFLNDVTNLQTSSWEFFGAGANDGLPAGILPMVSYEMSFRGTQQTPVVTMMAHANRGEFNHSNNPTYVNYGQIQTPQSSSNWYIDAPLTIKNTTKSPYSDTTGSFEKTTYITKIGIYDENQNLIGIASVAKPVKKTEHRDLTFKLKMDF